MLEKVKLEKYDSLLLVSFLYTEEQITVVFMVRPWPETMVNCTFDILPNLKCPNLISFLTPHTLGCVWVGEITQFTRKRAYHVILLASLWTRFDQRGGFSILLQNNCWVNEANFCITLRRLQSQSLHSQLNFSGMMIHRLLKL